jgi:hypothetical protein
VSSGLRRLRRDFAWANGFQRSAFWAATPSGRRFRWLTWSGSPAELDDAQAVSPLVNYNTMYFALAYAETTLKPARRTRYPI